MPLALLLRYYTRMQDDSSAAFYEFFAGGGLARLGLAGSFRCRFANDIDPAKTAFYARAFGTDEISTGDVWSLRAKDLPGRASLAWASFPCQDLSLAGARAGLSAPRSGAFWGFWRLIEQLDHEGRAPPVIALENVMGLLSSHRGADFAALISVLSGRGYKVGALTVDAAHFVPQSRQRLIVVAARSPAPQLVATEPDDTFHGPRLVSAVEDLPDAARRSWVWWRLPEPPKRNTALEHVLDARAPWDARERTAALIAMMSPKHQTRVREMQALNVPRVGAVFKRIRIEDGERVQRAEVRFDGVAGCLRTPAGGSSRQTIILVDGKDIRSRLLSPREAARLMGAPDDFPMPDNRTAALHLFGDAVCAPVVAWLGEHLLAPLAAAQSTQRAA